MDSSDTSDGASTSRTTSRSGSPLITNRGRRKFLKPLNAGISEVGIYSYCAICAISLYQLFPDEWDRPFRERTLSRLINHLGLPEQVRSGMDAFLSGEGGSVDPLISVLKEESSLRGNCLQVVEDLILCAVEDGIYDARMRVLILHMACLLHVALPLVEIYEESVVEMLSQEVQEQTEEEFQESERRKFKKKVKRYFLIGAATLTGGALMGLTGGLAAPLVAAGTGALIGGAGAAALGSTAGIALIGSLFGMAGAGLTGYKMKKRVGDIEEFTFETLSEGQQLHVTLAVTGWLSEKGGFCQPWTTLLHSREQYTLRYESAYLLELGRAMDYLFSFAVSMAAQEALKYTILSGLITAITWPSALITVAGVIDNPWGVCINRSAQVGRHLADVLLSRHHGKRPITLIGYSLGARVIFYCLSELARRKGCEGIVENAILLGAPVTADLHKWGQLTRVVSGRIVNGYCRGDWLLKFLYRTSSANFRIAGLQPILCENRRMCNVDLSDVVAGHMDYATNIELILKAVGVRTRENLSELDSALRKSRSDIPKPASALRSTSRLSRSAESLPSLRSVAAPSSALLLTPRAREMSISLESMLSGGSATILSPTGLIRSDSPLPAKPTHLSSSLDWLHWDQLNWQ